MISEAGQHTLLGFFGTTGMLYIWGAIPLRHLLPVNSIATVKADFREGR